MYSKEKKKLKYYIPHLDLLKCPCKLVNIHKPSNSWNVGSVHSTHTYHTLIVELIEVTWSSLPIYSKACIMLLCENHSSSIFVPGVGERGILKDNELECRVPNWFDMVQFLFIRGKAPMLKYYDKLLI